MIRKLTNHTQYTQLVLYINNPPVLEYFKGTTQFKRNNSLIYVSEFNQELAFLF